MSIITIVGAGMMGSALSFPLSDNGHTIRLVGTPLDTAIIDSVKSTNFHSTLKFDMPKNVTAFQFDELDEALKGTDLVVDGVSSFGVEWFAKNALPRLPQVPVIAVTKGLKDFEDGSMITFPEYLQQLCPENKRPLCAIGGPCTSYELASRWQTTVAFCGEDINVLNTLRGIFETSYYHITCTTDVRGIETAVAFKNAYALAITMAVGILKRDEGDDATEAYNPQAGIFAQSVREISRFINFMGGKPEHIDFGAGDLYVTVYGGRTRKLGILLGKDVPYKKAREILAGITLESVEIATRSARSVRKLATQGKLNLDDFPLLLHVDDIINHGAAVNIPWNKFR